MDTLFVIGLHVVLWIQFGIFRKLLIMLSYFDSLWFWSFTNYFKYNGSSSSKAIKWFEVRYKNSWLRLISSLLIDTSTSGVNKNIQSLTEYCTTRSISTSFQIQWVHQLLEGISQVNSLLLCGCSCYKMIRVLYV